MFTNNYIKYQKMMFTATSGSISTAFIDAAGTSCSCLPEYSYHGNIGPFLSTGRCRTIKATHTASTTYYSQCQHGDVYPGVYFGSGSTPATKEDYALASPITSGLSITNGNAVYTQPSEGVYVVQASYILRNTTEAEINIWEIGCFGAAGYSKNGYISHLLLFERTVLDEPVTIAPGETKLVTYKITFNQP